MEICALSNSGYRRLLGFTSFRASFMIRSENFLETVNMNKNRQINENHNCTGKHIPCIFADATVPAQNQKEKWHNTEYTNRNFLECILREGHAGCGTHTDAMQIIIIKLCNSGSASKCCNPEKCTQVCTGDSLPYRINDGRRCSSFRWWYSLPRWNTDFQAADTQPVSIQELSGFLPVLPASDPDFYSIQKQSAQR